MKTFWKWLLSFFDPRPRKPRDVIYGLEAIACQRENLRVKAKHHEILSAMRKVPLYSPEYNELSAKMDANLRTFDEIEARYFGVKIKT